MTKPTGLAEPLADALDQLSISDFEWNGPTHCAAIVLAALRADPATLAVIAEALHEFIPSSCYSWNVAVDKADHLKTAVEVADALFGAPPTYHELVEAEGGTFIGLETGAPQ